MKNISTDFQCPDTGFGVYLIYDDEKGTISAERCETGCWLECDKETAKSTDNWCKHFGNRYYDSPETADRVAERYDCWF